MNLIDQLTKGDMKNKFVVAKKLTNKEIARMASAGETAMTEDEMFTHTLQPVSYTHLTLPTIA